MGEMGSLLSLMIQGRKIEFRFGGVRLFLPGSYKALASFSTRDVDRWVSTIHHPDISLPVNRHQIFDSIRNLSTYPCFSVSTIPEKDQYFLQIAPPRNVCKRHRYLSTMRRLSIMNNGRTGQVLSRHFTVSSSPHLLIIKISTARGMTLFVKWIERRDKVESKMRWILRINSILFFSFFFLGLMNGFLFYLFLKGYITLS